MRNDVQFGSWKSINSTCSEDMLSSEVFSLWIDHGVSPSDAAYEYIVLPGVDKRSLSAYAQKIPVRTILNTADIQAVRNDRIGVTGIVFYKEGVVEIREGVDFRVDSPCMVLIDESGTPFRVSISSPDRDAAVVQADLLIDRLRVQSLSFWLPSGAEAGKSATLEFQNW